MLFLKALLTLFCDFTSSYQYSLFRIGSSQHANWFLIGGEVPSCISKGKCNDDVTSTARKATFVIKYDGIFKYIFFFFLFVYI